MKNSNTNIVDSYGRAHTYLRISLTEKCNLRCFYCMPEEGVPLKEKSVFMSPTEVVSIAKKFVDLGVTKIRLTGGEPLVKKGVDPILKELGKLPVELSLTTNGILVDRFIDTFQSAGIKKINVSLDSLVEERFNAISRRSYFVKIRENIQLLLSKGFHVKINVVLIRGTNEDEIIDFINWSIHEEVSVQFIEFMPFDGNNWDSSKTISAAEILDQVNAHFGSESILKLNDSPNSTSRNYQIKNGLGSFGIISSVTNPFCDSCNRIRLTADGKIKNCLFSNDEGDLLSRFRAGEDIESIIRQTIGLKKIARGGLPALDDTSLVNHENRSMITIGG